MSESTAATLRLRAALTQRADHIAELLKRYGASNPRLFGSVARGDAKEDSDLDLLVDLVPGAGNELLSVAGLAEELKRVPLGVRVDVVTAALLRDEVSAHCPRRRGRSVSRSDADRLADILVRDFAVHCLPRPSRFCGTGLDGLRRRTPQPRRCR